MSLGCSRQWIAFVALLGCVTIAERAQSQGGETRSAPTKSHWRPATAAELEAFLPARAPVEKERIETELRTATGIVNERGQTVAAVVLITAGYAANGKYSHYLLTQAPLLIGTEIRLAPGAYVLGWTRNDEGLMVHLYEAATGVERGSVEARIPQPPVRVEPFRIWPPAERSVFQIGRFLLPYKVDP